ncbi:histidinol phosphate phosphatase [Aristophania vespae]|uniref:Histidinol phosphate phosphatase n=1 Tax=Aristophania vespae TaxID=2697033 RepID=A0A6P1NFY9_9PROT|nr:inositol monophosphatase family protein [Aristophania vespae]QHI95440.1 histidinol phosphate phosphatase [Aristophania vespae]
MIVDNFSQFLPIARDCADAARACIKPYFRANITIDTKQDNSPVTMADRKAEQAMREIIMRKYPSHSILGEEEGQEGHLSGEWLWILDPIDGTRSFVTGRPSFCTLISLFHKGKPVLGLVDQPITEERWIGIEGEKTQFMSPNITGSAGTRQCNTISRAELSCTSPEIISQENKSRFEKLQNSVKRTSWGGDAYAYGLLSLGHIDLIAEDTLKPWDWAALVPVIKGAGGTITDWNGHALTLESKGNVLACGSPNLLGEAVKALS